MMTVISWYSGWMPGFIGLLRCWPCRYRPAGRSGAYSGAVGSGQASQRIHHGGTEDTEKKERGEEGEAWLRPHVGLRPHVWLRPVSVRPVLGVAACLLLRVLRA